MRKFVWRFLRDDSGATAIEYALVATGIGIAIVSAVQTVGSNLSAKWNTVAASLN